MTPTTATATAARPLLLPERLSERGPAGAVLVAASPQLWLVDTTAYRAHAARHAPGTLDAQELARAAEFVRAADRDAYVCAHVALRRLLGAYLGTAPREVIVERAPCTHCEEPHGRPVLPGGALHFSLSHCTGISLLAFATAPVGVDVEEIVLPQTIAETADVLHPREAAELALLPAGERPVAFTRVWTRKEAYLKGLGVGLSEDPAADYVGSGPAPARLPGWNLTDVRVPDGHCGAVALQTVASG
ncbi:4'-phosphopantetheinyl transferase superfamily protein [Streptomyces sp. NBC_01408]|uniref:4'-phosphopantetheinyl transferase family protein n=1 Tax=Streptomyces sp. NBC_01408 TaxID=2903855 RepID=UPI00225C1BBB|nr:4'-phosphopantetheinyl transferase superfamily protein [Streptomyces sp. NBC_01408]MCX4696232.1 4'-phosphopantetheinyl transferase superfamily protein [Streptomyces sp. NBC_01408]